ncbi:hypothetical protein [Paraburkholderia acidipaludis]|uniref:hypothetical protein n=1 Tax=Paraburkholderia acidipaludis TaxID=660537 RepID=UPI0012EBC517|nr:hypothetical protein [Paraburkholderia acidipaludis]
MKISLFLFTALLFSTSSVWAEKSNTDKVVIREVEIGGCHFKMRDPYGGVLTLTTDRSFHYANYRVEVNPKSQRRFETEIQFECHDNVNISDLSDLAGIGRENGKWIINFSGNAAAVNTKLYPLGGQGWDGAGITQDQVGDDGGRSALTFCIMHHSQALCGQDDTVMYLDYPEESVLPQIIRLLNSIKFVN